MHVYDKAVMDLLNGKRLPDTAQNRRIISLMISMDMIPQEMEDGGPGSGNWGHKGRIGKRGGSGKGGGRHNRQGSKEEGYSRRFDTEKIDWDQKFANPGGMFNRQWGWGNQAEKWAPKVTPKIDPNAVAPDPYKKDNSWATQNLTDGPTKATLGLLKKSSRGKWNANNPTDSDIQNAQEKLCEGHPREWINYLYNKIPRTKNVMRDEYLNTLKSNGIQLSSYNYLKGGNTPPNFPISFTFSNLTNEQNKKISEYLNFGIMPPDGHFYQFNGIQHIFQNVLDGKTSQDYQCFMSLANKAAGGAYSQQAISRMMSPSGLNDPKPSGSYDKVIKGDEFSEKIAAMRKPDRKYTDQEINDAGKLVSEELQKAIVKDVDSHPDVIKAKDEKDKASDLLDKARLKYTQARTYIDMEQAHKEYNKAKAALDAAKDRYESERGKVSAKALTSVLSRIRQVGIDEQQKGKLVSHLPGHSSMKYHVQDAYNIYPTEWVQASIDHGPMKISKINRGHYSDAFKELCISTYGQGAGFATAVHELGHRMEYVFRDRIMDAEAQFYKRRTQGESLSWLGSGYGSNQVTRRDHFIHPYMGKDYGGDGWELVSMGFEMAAVNPQKLHTDPDYERFILGILAFA